MKKTLYLLLCFALIISFCSCDTAHPESSDMPEPSDGNIYDDSELKNDIALQETEITTAPALLASEVLCEITDISNEWLPGRYLVYGVDFYGSPCYGIIDVNGVFEYLHGYAAYFPLADGNLLVTNDPDANLSLRCASRKTTDISNGKITDRNGNILFEATENQRMHVINSTNVMIIEATSGFDGTTLRYGLIDHQGNWLKNLDSDGLLIDFLLEYLEFNNGESWNYNSRISIICCEGYDGLDSQSIMFCKDDFHANDPVLVYDSDTDTFFETISYGNKVIQASANEWLRFHMGYSNVPWGNSSDTYVILDRTGQESGSIKHYHSTINGIKYWTDYDYEFSGASYKDYVKSEYLIIGSDAHPDGYTFPADYSQRVRRIAGFTENQIWLIVKGADDRLYFTSHDIEGNTIVKPTLLDGFSGGYSIVAENHLVCYDSVESFSLYVLNPASASLTAGYLGVALYPEDIWSIGNGLVALKFRENKKDYIFIYSLEGKCLYQSII